MSIRPLKWILLETVLALLLFGHGSSAEWPSPPRGQPAQMWSRVDYDPKLTDPFFKPNEWGYPLWITKYQDGQFEDPSTGITLEKEPPRLKHTAKCFATSMGGPEHSVRFCEARLLHVNRIDLFIHESNLAYHDRLIVQIRNGMFTCQFWTLFKVRAEALRGAIWTTKRQKLTLDKKAYRKGDAIKGRIDFECVQDKSNPNLPQHYSRSPTTIEVYGVFKTIVE